MITGIILAAGSGTRFGSTKQDELLAGVPLWERAVETAVKSCDRVILVHSTPLLASTFEHVTVIPGGSTRSGSVREALAQINEPGPDDIIVVHDAARPLASMITWSRVIRAVMDGAVCAVPTIPIPDTIRRRSGQPADRDAFWIVQTPQAFDAGTLMELHQDEPECSDDAGLITLGVTTVDGDPANIKVTHPGDIEVAEAHIRRSGR